MHKCILFFLAKRYEGINQTAILDFIFMFSFCSMTRGESCGIVLIPWPRIEIPVLHLFHDRGATCIAFRCYIPWLSINLKRASVFPCHSWHWHFWKRCTLETMRSFWYHQSQCSLTRLRLATPLLYCVTFSKVRTPCFHHQCMYPFDNYNNRASEFLPSYN